MRIGSPTPEEREFFKKQQQDKKNQEEKRVAGIIEQLKDTCRNLLSLDEFVALEQYFTKAGDERNEYKGDNFVQNVFTPSRKFENLTGDIIKTCFYHRELNLFHVLLYKAEFQYFT